MKTRIVSVKNPAVLLFIFVFLFCSTLPAVPPFADIVFTGNLSAVPSKTELTYIAHNNTYGVWVLGGNTFASPGKKADSFEQQKKLFAEHNKKFFHSFAVPMPMLAVLGENDFEAGLHYAVSSLRHLRPAYVFVLDYIGARNNENPYLLRYIDLLVNGKTLRFIGLGAWEKLSPSGRDILYRKPTPAILKEIGDYLKERKKVDFTILITCQKLKYDKELAADPLCAKIFDLILSNDPAAPLYTEEKNSVPIAGGGKNGEEMRKIFLNPVTESVAGPPIQVWRAEKYHPKTTKSTTTKKVNIAKKQEKKKK